MSYSDGLQQGVRNFFHVAKFQRRRSVERVCVLMQLLRGLRIFLVI